MVRVINPSRLPSLPTGGEGSGERLNQAKETK